MRSRWFLQSSVGAWVGLLWVNSALQYTKEAGGFKSAIRAAEGRGTKISGERGDNRLIPALPPGVLCHALIIAQGREEDKW